MSQVSLDMRPTHWSHCLLALPALQFHRSNLLEGSQQYHWALCTNDQVHQPDHCSQLRLGYCWNWTYPHQVRHWDLVSIVEPMPYWYLSRNLLVYPGNRRKGYVLPSLLIDALLEGLGSLSMLWSCSLLMDWSFSWLYCSYCWCGCCSVLANCTVPYVISHTDITIRLQRILGIRLCRGSGKTTN